MLSSRSVNWKKAGGGRGEGGKEKWELGKGLDGGEEMDGQDGTGLDMDNGRGKGAGGRGKREGGVYRESTLLPTDYSARCPVAPGQPLGTLS